MGYFPVSMLRENILGMDFGMGKQEMTQTEKLVNVLVVLCLVFLCMFEITGIYCFTAFPDEFGYWASAARFLHYDWSEVASIGSYYSFGYSLLLTPILFIFKDAVIAYRAAVVLNLLMQLVAIFLIKDIFVRLFKDSDEIARAIIAGMAVLYPAWTFYAQMTMTEALLSFMFILIIWLMLRYLEKPTIVRGLLAGLAALYIYTVHMRTVGILVSVALVVIVHFISTLFDKESKKNSFNVLVSSIVVLLVFAVGVFLATILKNRIIADLYTSGIENSVSFNDYSGQVGKLNYLLSLEGLKDFFLSLSGKLVYLFCATFGTAYIGVYSLIKRAFRHDKNAFFILLAAFAEFMVMCIYVISSASIYSDRYDIFFHGRYFDFAVPILIAFGMMELIYGENILKKMLVSGVVFAVSLIASTIIVAINETGFCNPHGLFMIGMCLFLEDKHVQPFFTLFAESIFAVVVCIAILLLIRFCKKKDNYVFLIFILPLMVFLGHDASSKYNLHYQIQYQGDMMVADAVRDLRSNGNNDELVIFYTNGNPYATTVQFGLRDEKIHIEYVDQEIIDDESRLKEFVDGLPDNKIYLARRYQAISDAINERFEFIWGSGHYDVYCK